MEKNKTRIFISFIEKKDIPIVKQIEKRLSSKSYDVFSYLDTTNVLEIDLSAKEKLQNAKYILGLISTPTAVRKWVNGYDYLKRLLPDSVFITLVNGDYSLPKNFKELNFIKYEINNIEKIVNDVEQIILSKNNSDTQIKSSSKVSQNENASTRDFPLGPKSKGSKVLLLQNALKKLGYYRVESTGIYNEETIIAVKNVQESNQVKETGITNEELFNNIISDSEKRIIPSTGYWLLKLRDTWNIEGLEIGVKKWFHTHRLDKMQRPEYNLFFSLKKGDKIIGYYFEKVKVVVCEFTVDKEVELNNSKDERVIITLSKVLDTKIPLEEFINNISVSQKDIEEEDRRLFSITENDYEIILTPPETLPIISTGNWLLKINSDNWDIKAFQKNPDAYFHTHTYGEEKRPEYKSFFSLKKGDIIIAYAFGTVSGFVCIFDVVQPVHNSKVNGERIELKVREIFDPPIPFSDIKGNVFSLNKATVVDFTAQRLYTARPKDIELVRNVKLPSPIPSPEPGTSTGYWFLKLNNKWYENRNMRLGEQKSFYTHDSLGKRRPDYDSFLSVRKDDKIIGYYYKNSREVGCEFIITEDLKTADPDSEKIQFIVTKIFDPGIPFTKFKDNISLKQNLIFQENHRLFSITEKDYDIILDPQKIPSHWLIKLNYTNWNVSDLTPGIQAWFNVEYDDGMRRPDYDLFFSVKKNDVLLGYSFSDDGKRNEVICTFKVNTEMHENPERKMSIGFTVDKILPVPLLLEDFQSKLTSIVTFENPPVKSLFRINEEEYNMIVNPPPPQEPEEFSHWVLKTNISAWEEQDEDMSSLEWFQNFRKKNELVYSDLLRKIKSLDKILTIEEGTDYYFIRAFGVKGSAGAAGQVKKPSIYLSNCARISIEDFLETDFHKKYSGKGEEVCKISFEDFLLHIKEINEKFRDTDLQYPEKTGDVVVTSVNAEGNHSKTQDKLGFKHDILSLANVISMKAVNPPLAIGLFGNWGTGKSFFMEKLCVKVDEFSIIAKKENEINKEKYEKDKAANINAIKPAESKYVENIVQVKFNSWHYSDANLWASLITEIFDSLKKFSLKEHKKSEIEKLEIAMQTAGKQKEAETKMNEELKKLTCKREIEKDGLAKVTGIKYAKEILKNFFTNENVKDLDTNIVGIVKSKTELEGYIKKIKDSGKILYIGRQILNLLSWQVAAASLIAFLLSLILFVFSNTRGIQFHDLLSISGWKIYFEWFTWWSSALIIFVSKVMTGVAEAFKNVKDAKEKLENVIKTIDTEPIDAELIKLKSDLENSTAAISNLNKKIAGIEQELIDIESGKKLFDFIDSKSKDTNYTQQLGVISWIRKDFSRLDELLRMQYELNSEEKKKFQNPYEVHLKIDRIILYIDDLDRCPQDIVVKVLEAIHLLLAFPLFIVVVGVDPRWLDNSLKDKFKVQFGNEVTSYDYLEKIFQIPFALKPITPEGKKSLIDYLLKKEMEKVETEEKEQEKSDTETKQETKQKTQEKDITDAPDDTKETIPANINPEISTNNDVIEGDAEDENNYDNTESAYEESDFQTTKTHSDEEKISNESIFKSEEKKEREIKPMTEKVTSSEGKKQQKENVEEDKEEEIEPEVMQAIMKNVSFTKKELAFMQEISSVFGHSPRTINRYINIYRIIKSHKGFKRTKIFSEDDFIPAMILLAIVVGCLENSHDFIEKIEKLDKASDDINFLEFLEKTDLPITVKENIKMCLSGSVNLRMKDFKRNRDLISRFSFRTIKKKASENGFSYRVD